MTSKIQQWIGRARHPSCRNLQTTGSSDGFARSCSNHHWLVWLFVEDSDIFTVGLMIPSGGIDRQLSGSNSRIYYSAFESDSLSAPQVYHINHSSKSWIRYYRLSKRNRFGRYLSYDLKCRPPGSKNNYRIYTINSFKMRSWLHSIRNTTACATMRRRYRQNKALHDVSLSPRPY